MARKGNPKVRTGCLTCKLRKVKCDEARPACRRCTGTGRDCDGYLPVKSPSSPPSKRRRGKRDWPGRPRLLAAASPGTGPHHQDIKIRKLHIPFANHFNTVEAHYFDTFRHRIAPRYPDRDFWEGTVLRETFLDDSIRDCVVALGAVWQALRHEQKWRKFQSASATPSRTTSPYAFSADHQQAAKYYARSISTFRARLSRCSSSRGPGAGVVSPPPRTIFIATYLFYTFEQIQGNAAHADALLLNGMAILRGHLSLLQARPALTATSPCAAALDDCGITPAENTLTRLAAIHMTGSPLRQQTRGSSTTTNTTFSDELVTRIMQDRVPDPTTSLPLDALLRLWDISVTRYGLWTFRTLTPDHDDPAAVASVTATREHIMEQYAQWDQLFTAKLAADPSAAQSAALEGVWPCLRISRMCMACFFDRSEMAWDAYLPDCEVVLAQLEEAAAAEQQQPLCETLNFAKCLFSLYVIAQKCRDAGVRRRALGLLRGAVVGGGGGGAEEDGGSGGGVSWDMRAFVVSSEVHVGVEEAGREKGEDGEGPGGIPAGGRYGWTRYRWSEDRTEMVLTLSRAVVGDNRGSEAGEVEVRVRPEEFGMA